ncbi:hypothetical protein IC229_15475 [Spirosoma sp. BT702]|uniref:Uncharacterized protein n=2 Tax=Spirosoma profusum TaxID=2771354 RepID=A0A926Y3M0_9BACT|nr:hypothetical protein [Spirosoma profusum]
MWRLRECPLNDEQLGISIGLSGNAIRNRRAKPDLWKLSDVERLASLFALPSTASIQLSQVLDDMPSRMKTLPADERRRIERMLLLKTSQLESYNKNDWPVRYLLRMHRSLLTISR